LIEPAERPFAGHSLFIHEDDHLVFGYTKGHFPSSALKLVFAAMPLLFLKQVHSGRIVSPGEWHAGIEADGLLLDRRDVVAVIQTADCLPLFFFNDEGSRGGVLHVGWRGLHQGIEERLAERLGGEFRKFSFFLGPGIEKMCYEVGEELKDLFVKKAYAKEILSISRPGRYWLDLKAGLKLSLKALGASDEKIMDSGLCTRCSVGLFPSFRRDGGTGRRIFNFLALRSPAPPAR
jgi:hypothetical protein